MSLSLSRHSATAKTEDQFHFIIPSGQLASGLRKIETYFTLKSKKWKYSAYFDSNEMLCISIKEAKSKWSLIRVNNTNHPVAMSDNSIKVKVGIAGEFMRKIAVADGIRTDNRKRTNFLASKLIHRSEFNLIMQENKVLYLFVEMKRESCETKNIIACKQKVEKDFEELLLSGKNSDVTIKVKNKEFKCHRCILGARSSVFSAMMEHDMKEKISGVVTINDSDPRTFQEFLLYLYTGNADHLDWEKFSDLYELGDKYDVDDLKCLCLEYIKNNITTDNFCEFFHLMQQCNDSEMGDVAVHFFLKNYEEIIDKDKWVTFLAENPSESNILIKALGKNRRCVFS